MRVPGIDVAQDKAEALSRLDRVHAEVRNAIGVGEMPFVTAEQVHGNSIAVVDGRGRPEEVHERVKAALAKAVTASAEGRAGAT